MLSEKSYYKWVAFVVVSIGTYMAALDSSIVNVSMPTITEFFHSDMATTNWIISIYLLTLSGTLLIFGKLSDMISRKKVFILGMAIFTVSSAACGLSGSLDMLIISRFVQAIGSAMLMANSPAIITEVFPHKERGKALGSIGTVVAMGIMTGAPLGGKLVTILSWRSIFFINIPVGIIGFALSILVLRDAEGAANNTGSFDFLGALLLIVFMVTFLLGLNIGSKQGFDQRIVYRLFAVSAVFFVIFLITELKTKNPTVELDLFRSAGFSSSNLTALVAYMTIFMVMFMLPFFLKNVINLTPDVIGAILITPNLMLFVFSPVFGWVSDKIGCRLLRCTGLAITALSLYLLADMMKYDLAGGPTVLKTILILLLYGFGIGMFIPPNSSLLMGSVPKNKLGVASGMLATTRNMGMMMGVAAASAIFTFKSNELSALLSDPLKREWALVEPYSAVFNIATVICLTGAVFAFFQGKGDVKGDPKKHANKHNITEL